MVWSPRLPLLAGLLVFGLAAGCTSGSDDPRPSSGSTTAPTSSSATVSSPSPSPSPTRVPVDQIPPGNPKEWVPAGVPTVAKYKEPGDVVPKFNQTMFKRTDAGALAMVSFYVQARRWGLAAQNPQAFTIICSADPCEFAKNFINQKARVGQHVSGQRITPGPPRVSVAPKDKQADFLVQLVLKFAAGALVSNSGSVVERYKAYSTRTNLYLSWTGKLWRVTGDFLAG